MKKLIIFIILLVLASCNKPIENNTNKETLKKSDSIETNNQKKEIKLEKYNIGSTKVSYNSYTMNGSIPKDIQKVQVIWTNGEKKDSYFLKTFATGSTIFKANISTDLGNLDYGDNKYIVNGFIGNEVKFTASYNLVFNKDGCDINILSPYKKDSVTNSNYTKYIGKIRKFFFHIDGKCENKTLSLDTDSTLKLDSGLKIYIEDTGTFMGGSELEFDTIKDETLSNGAKISLGKRCTIEDNNQKHCTDYNILGGISSIGVKVLEGLNRDNMYLRYDEVKNILQTFKEKGVENIIFNPNTVDIKSIQVKGNSIILTDSNGIKKEVKTNYQIYKDGDLEDVKNGPQTTFDFERLKGNNLGLSISIGNLNSGFLDYNIVIDMKTGKTIKFDKQEESPQE